MKKDSKKGHTARSGKRWLALLMSLCLIGTMVPVTARAEAGRTGEPALMSLGGFSLTGKPASATVKTINLDAKVLRPDSTWSKSDNTVYFGNYNGTATAYRVLSAPNTQTDSDKYLLLDCDTILSIKKFDEDRVKNDEQIHNPNEWKGSDLEKWLKGTDFYGGSAFSALEKTAIAETALEEQSVYNAGDNGYSYRDYSATNHVFCLSVAEADGLYEDNNARKKTGGLGTWWLRSADSFEGNLSGFVHPVAKFGRFYVDDSTVGVSPAFNVDLSSVLFASVSGQSASGEAPDKSSALAPVSDSTATQWKLTLLDSRKFVEVTNGQSVTRQDSTITVPYTYMDYHTSNPASQISVMITDKAYNDSNAQVLYYGALQDVTISKTGTGTFTLPEELADKSCGADYYAYIIAEAVNGEKETDYASEPCAITIPDTPADPVNGKGLGVSIIADPTAPAAATDAWKGSYVYFGTYNGNPVKYRVLDRTTTDFGGTTMLLDCDSLLWSRKNSDNQSSRFDDDKSNVWADSEIKTYLNGTFLTKNFSSLEQAAIASSTKASPSDTDGSEGEDYGYCALSGDKIFLLDVKEVTNTSYGYSNTDDLKTKVANREKTGGDDNSWWLRSPFLYPNDEGNQFNWYSSYVFSDGSINKYRVWDETFGVSPALNVNLSSVLFSSVLSGTSGQPGAEYKLTLQDDKMTITPGTITRNLSDEVTVPYTIGGENASNATQVSLMVLDKEYTAGNTNGAKLVAYEKLADAGSTTGTFTLTGDMKNGSYYYYIVAEDVNADKASDYASAPVQISVPASASKFTVTVTNGTLSGGGTTGDYAQGETVTITAGAAPGGQQFKEWEVVSGSITLASSTSETTTFTMPAEKVSVKAVYEDSSPSGGDSPSGGGTTGEASESNASTTAAPKKDTLLTDSKTRTVYKVTKAGTTGGTVQFTKSKDTKAKTITIPATVTVDGITYKVTSIAAGALKNNKAVTTVTLGKYVKSIGKDVFKGLTKLKTIKITSTLLTTKTVSKYAFSGISAKTVVKVPKSKLKAYKSLLVKKGLDKKVTIKSL